MGLISPNDLIRAAKDQMLGGKEPATHRDWQLIANFWAANLAAGLEESGTILLRLLYPECPLTKEELIDIAEFQAARKPE